MMKNILFLIFICCSQILFAQKNKNQTTDQNFPFDTSIISQLQFREIGPWRGGRSTAVVGHPENKQLYYFGATGGGVWKSIDGGNNWNNISDGFFGGSVGAIAVSKSDPSIIYVGMGENSMRGNVSEGFGMWKSENAGRTWKHVGLSDTRHITRIVIHPKNSNIIYCAALGHLFGANSERGIFRSKDGGATWQKVAYVNDKVGAIDLVMDPTDPNILLATFWNVKRTPYSLESGGVGSGIHKSMDGGDTWTNISHHKGLPKDTLGIIGITISQTNPEIYYAIIESKTGGVFKSTDAGKTWNKLNDESKLRQRAWYYSKIFCDPSNENIVYVLNVEFWKSTDGGKTYTSIHTPHVDHHDLWIDPNDAQRMIIADDGGAQVSTNGGKQWTTYYNQPTSQIYRVTTDNDVPYRILGAQQDNTSLRIKHRSEDGQIDGNDWEPTAGFESGHIVADPDNYDLVYGGNYSGFIGCYNHQNGDVRNITVWPNDPLGQGADLLKYRFQWNFPLFFSPHDPDKLYAAGNVLFYTKDNGTTWTPISPDLTTNDKSKQLPSGGIITKDNTSVEFYCTIFAAAESPIEKDVIYVGSDDGLIHITKNGGESWQNITPADLPPFTMINSIEIDPNVKGKMYFAGTRYKSDDFQPYLYVTENYGSTWKKITNGIDALHFTRVIRADKKRSGLLFCGTEYGLYISYNDGNNWYPFQNNLPIVPITDMTMKNNDLIIATQGRGFWVLDDMVVLQEIDAHKNKNMHVYSVRDSYLIAGYQIENPVNAGKNPKPGVVINYFIAGDEKTDTGGIFSVSLYDDENILINTYSTDAKEKDLKIDVSSGLNQFNWNFQYAKAESVEGMFLWNGSPSGPRAAPGNYSASIKYGQDSIKIPFTILRDPNSDATSEDQILQHDFLIQVRDKFNEVQKAITELRAVQTQMNDYLNKLGVNAPQELKDTISSLNKRINTVIETVYETRNKSNQDMLNYGIKLNDKLAGVYNAAAYGNFRPSQNQREVFKELSREADAQLQIYRAIKTDEVEKVNALIKKLDLPIIIVP